MWSHFYLYVVGVFIYTLDIYDETLHKGNGTHKSQNITLLHSFINLSHKEIPPSPPLSSE